MLTNSLEETFNRSKELADKNDSLVQSQTQLAEKEAELAAETEKTMSWKGKVFVADQLNSFFVAVLLLTLHIICKPEQVSQMESMVKSLQQRLVDNAKEASVTQEQLQQSVADYQSKNNDLEAQLREAQVSATALQTVTTGEEDECEKLQALQASLDDARELLRAERENQSVTEASLEESEGKQSAT